MRRDAGQELEAKLEDRRDARASRSGVATRKGMSAAADIRRRSRCLRCCPTLGCSRLAHGSTTSRLRHLAPWDPASFRRKDLRPSAAWSP